MSRYIPVDVDTNTSSRAAFQGLIVTISQGENQVTDNEVSTQVSIDFQGNLPPPPADMTVVDSLPHAGDSVRVSASLLFISVPFYFW